MTVWQWRRLDNMQIIYALLQTDNYASTSPPNQQNQSTEENKIFPPNLQTVTVAQIVSVGGGGKGRETAQ